MTLTKERMRERLHYNPTSGIFIHTKATKGHVAGQIAGCPTSAGHIRIMIDGASYYAHHLAWLWMTGKWPGEIDHRNTNPGDNRWDNLREATRQQNSMNRGCNRNNRLRLKGVSREDAAYKARISIAGKEIRIGRFDCPAAAHFAYIVEASTRFGEFARG